MYFVSPNDYIIRINCILLKRAMRGTFFVVRDIAQKKMFSKSLRNLD